MNGKLSSCTECSQLLTILNEGDLSYSDRTILLAHLELCSTCNTIRMEYLALAYTLAQDVPYDPPVEIPPKLQRHLQKKSEYMDIPIEDIKKENGWERMLNGFVKPFEEDHRPHT